MAKFYKVSPKFKKSIFEYQSYQSEDGSIRFQTEEMYRWGHAIFKVESDEELTEIIGDKDDDYNEFEFDHTMTEDQEVDDQCSFYFENVKGIDTQELDVKFEEEGYDYIRDVYGDPHEFYVVYHGPLNVEEVTDEWQGK